jgi:membrane protease YdiL (CAAX protease family)
MLGAAFVLMRRYGGRPSAAELGFRSTHARAAVGWVVLARLGYLIAAVAYVNMVGGVTPNIPVQPSTGVTTLDQVDVVLAIVIIAPIAEELFFRGFMYASLRGRLNVFWAALISGGLFAAVHPIYGTTAWNLVPVLAIAGIVLCLLYEKTGSLWPAIAFHCWLNIGILVLIVGDTTVPLAIVGTVGLLFLIAPWRFVRSGAATPPPPPSPPRHAIPTPG